MSLIFSELKPGDTFVQQSFSLYKVSTVLSVRPIPGGEVRVRWLSVRTWLDAKPPSAPEVKERWDDFFGVCNVCWGDKVL